MLERSVENEILRVFGTRRDMRIWPAKVGRVRIKGRVVQFGVIGQADISGLVLINGMGVRLEIECKRPDGGRVSDEQQKYGEMIKRFGGIYVVARSADDVWKALAAAGWREG